jgi:hypothetical protein
MSPDPAASPTLSVDELVSSIYEVRQSVITELNYSVKVQKMQFAGPDPDVEFVVLDGVAVAGGLVPAFDAVAAGRAMHAAVRATGLPWLRRG